MTLLALDLSQKETGPPMKEKGSKGVRPKCPNQSAGWGFLLTKKHPARAKILHWTTHIRVATFSESHLVTHLLCLTSWSFGGNVYNRQRAWLCHRKTSFSLRVCGPKVFEGDLPDSLASPPPQWHPSYVLVLVLPRKNWKRASHVPDWMQQYFFPWEPKGLQIIFVMCMTFEVFL